MGLPARLLPTTMASMLFLVGAAAAQGTYPRTIVANAKVVSGATTLASTITIRIDRLALATRRDRVLKGFQRNSYQGLMDELRKLPVIGAIATQNAEVAVRYAWEAPEDGKSRLVIVADKPLVFLPGDESKARPAYQLTVVQLTLDDRGAGTGRMAAAARVKPTPTEGIVLEDYASAPIELTVLPPATK